MKYLEIKLENNKSILVDESAEITQIDYWLNLDDNSINNRFNWLEANNTPSCKLIIATINHSIDLDVPMVIVDDDYNMEKDWGNLALLKMACESSGIGNAYYKEKARLELKYTSQQKGIYSEKDILSIIYDYDNVDWSKRESKQSTIMLKEWLNEKLQTLNQEYIELEIEEISDNKTNDFGKKQIYYQKIKTNRNADGQLMAYIKQ